jgi:hypothetical protein
MAKRKSTKGQTTIYKTTNNDVQNTTQKTKTQEAKIQFKAKTARYDRIINELCHFYKVSLIKPG